MADDLSAQGSGLRARQTKRSPHAQEERTPTPAVNLKSTSTSSPRAWKERERLSVGKDVQQPKQFTVDRPDVETIAGRKA